MENIAETVEWTYYQPDQEGDIVFYVDGYFLSEIPITAIKYWAIEEIKQQPFF